MPDQLTYEHQHYEVIYQGKTKQKPITIVETAPPPKKKKTDTPAKEQNTKEHRDWSAYTSHREQERRKTDDQKTITHRSSLLYFNLIFNF